MGKSIAQKNDEQLILQHRTQLERMKTELSAESLRVAEDKLLEECMEIVQGLLDFSALGFDPDGKLDESQLPEAWSKLTLEQKTRKIRLAKYGCLTTAEIPHGAKMAHATMIGIISARAKEQSGTRVLNLEVSTFPAPKALKDDAIDTEYEVIDLE